MVSTRKFAWGDKKNHSNGEKLALGDLLEKYKKEKFKSFEKSPLPTAIIIWKIFQPDLLFQPPPPPPNINIWNIVQPPPPSPLHLLTTKEYL